MKSASEWFELYSRTHQNTINRRIHKICVPLIYASVLALLWTIPRPGGLENYGFLNWATFALFFLFLFYLRLGLIYFMQMMIFSLIILGVIMVAEALGLPLAWISLAVFVLAWIGQFYGHKREGKSPAFFADLAFLLIGPLWIINGHAGSRTVK